MSTPHCHPNSDLFGYIGDIDEELECMICSHPVWNPLIHECGRVFGRECFNSVFQANKQCPNCFSPENTSSSIIPLQTKNKLNGIKVRCNNCDLELLRLDYIAHISHCAVGMYIITCRIHYYSQSYTTDCPLNCGEKVFPLQLKQHEDACENKIVCCSAKNVLCGWTGPRKELSHHIEQCDFVKLTPVLSKLLSTISTLQTRIQVTEAEIVVLKENNNRGRKIPSDDDSEEGKSITIKNYLEAPNKPLSAYMLFCKKERVYVKAEYPDMKAKDVLFELGKRWKAIDDEERKQLQSEFEANKKIWDKQMAEYKEKKVLMQASERYV
jgi:hypothetical protein